ncbi:MAG: Rrf2 family transcriptional regulator, partial [Clostridia bacterium]|nr:Rrf2 family transcriptional regulator [Clostridia bacterium]
MISTRGRYALRVLIDIAENSNGNYIPLNDIASRQDISEKYL